MEHFTRNIAVVFLLSTFYFLFSTAEAGAAVLYSGSAQQTVTAGGSFVVDWFLDTEGQAINTVALDLRFTPQNLQVAEISRGNSLLNLWIREPVFSNESGTISLTGGISGGVDNPAVPLFRAVFRALKPGPARISMEESSMALAHDGRGTAAGLRFQSLNFIVAPEGGLPIGVHSPSHPEQDNWYRQNRAVIVFEPKAGESYSYSFSSNAEIAPDFEIDDIPKELVFADLPDGTYYFKLNAEAGQGSFQEAGFYRVQIDAAPPEEFQPIVSSDSSVYDGRPFVSFFAVDKTSGVSHYEIEAWPAVWKQISSPYLISRPLVRSLYGLRAYDEAGNYREVKVPIRPLAPWYIWPLIALAAAMALTFRARIWQKNKI